MTNRPHPRWHDNFVGEIVDPQPVDAEGQALLERTERIEEEHPDIAASVRSLIYDGAPDLAKEMLDALEAERATS